MKRILIVTASAILALTAASCHRETALEPAERTGIVLNVRCSAPETKATLSGEDTYNENQINTLDYFFYAAGAENAAPILKGHTTPDAKNQATLSIKVNEEEVNRLFPGLATTCTVFLVANYPGTFAEDGQPTLAELKALEVSAAFSAGKQGSFVMTAEATVNLISRKRTLAAEETVELKRLASKISIQFKVAESAALERTVVSDGVSTTTTTIWKPVLDNMRIYLVNGVSNTTLSGAPASSPATFRYAEQDVTETVTSGDQTYYTLAPFYSYPQTWEYGDATEPFLKLVIPWQKQGGDQTLKQYYYRIFCPGTAFERNKWYRIIIDVAILGSEMDEVALDIQGSYYVADWGAPVGTTASIVSARYLSVPQSRYDLYSIEDLTFDFISSHSCELTDVTATYPNVAGNTATDTPISDAYTLNLSGRTITFHHTINDDYSSPDFIASPMKFQFTIHQTDDTEGSFDHTVTIYQYPSMSLEASQNSTYNASTFPSGTGNVYVNGQQKIVETANGSAWDEIIAINKGTNQNPNMYIIEVGNLGEEINYLIGDPRQTSIDNLAYNLPLAALELEGGTRNLTWYYPTEDSERTRNMLAPKIRVASSYGMSGQQVATLNDAKKRCASYQEDGYPAGRWRLPTFAEIDFISSLSIKGLIPKLFSISSSGAYWSAHGRVYEIAGTPTLTPNSNTSDNSKQMVRCVYDEWYWSGTCDKTTPTWGDSER